MLVSIAVADAYGAGFEFEDWPFVEDNNDLSRYVTGSRLSSPKGCYTDDTQMTIGIVEAMLSGKNLEDITERDFMGFFLKAFKRDPRRTYSTNFLNILDESSTVDELMDKITPESVRNGAAMRSVPIGLIRDVELLKAFAAAQAKCTHDTHEGIVSSQAVALAVNYFLYQNGLKDGLQQYLYNETGEFFKTDVDYKVPCQAIETIDAALSVIVRSNSLSECIKNSVALGGDTDTVSVIVVGIAYFCQEIKNDIPDHLVSGLENGEFGIDFLSSLNTQLFKKFNLEHLV